MRSPKLIEALKVKGNEIPRKFGIEIGGKHKVTRQHNYDDLAELDIEDKDNMKFFEYYQFDEFNKIISFKVYNFTNISQLKKIETITIPQIPKKPELTKLFKNGQCILSYLFHSVAPGGLKKHIQPGGKEAYIRGECGKQLEMTLEGNDILIFRKAEHKQGDFDGISIELHQNLQRKNILDTFITVTDAITSSICIDIYSPEYSKWDFKYSGNTTSFPMESTISTNNVNTNTNANTNTNTGMNSNIINTNNNNNSTVSTQSIEDNCGFGLKNQVESLSKKVEALQTENRMIQTQLETQNNLISLLLKTINYPNNENYGFQTQSNHNFQCYPKMPSNIAIDNGNNNNNNNINAICHQPINIHNNNNNYNNNNLPLANMHSNTSYQCSDCPQYNMDYGHQNNAQSPSGISSNPNFDITNPFQNSQQQLFQPQPQPQPQQQTQQLFQPQYQYPLNVIQQSTNESVETPTNSDDTNSQNSQPSYQTLTSNDNYGVQRGASYLGSLAASRDNPIGTSDLDLLSLNDFDFDDLNSISGVGLPSCFGNMNQNMDYL